MRWPAAAVVLALAVGTSACRRSEPMEPSPPAPAPAVPATDTGPDVVYVTTFEDSTDTTPPADTADTGAPIVYSDEAHSFLTERNAGRDMVAGDFDEDGLVELVSHTSARHDLVAWDADGTVGDRSPELWWTGPGLAELFAEDLTADGRPDLVARELVLAGSILHVFPTPFDIDTRAQILRPADKPPCITDIDQDGFLDVVTYFHALDIYYGPFVAGEVRDAPEAAFDISGAYSGSGVDVLMCPGDLTGDGYDDVLVYSSSRYGIAPGPFTRDGEPPASTPWMLPHTSVSRGDGVIPDIDGTGRTAIVVRHTDPDTLERRLDFVLTPVGPDPVSLDIVGFDWPVSFARELPIRAIGDVNGDGLVDAVASVRMGPSWLYENTTRLLLGPLLELPPDDPLSEPELILAFDGVPLPHSSVDVDLDGRLDVVVGVAASQTLQEGLFVFPIDP